MFRLTEHCCNTFHGSWLFLLTLSLNKKMHFLFLFRCSMNDQVQPMSKWVMDTCMNCQNKYLKCMIINIYWLMIVLEAKASLEESLFFYPFIIINNKTCQSWQFVLYKSADEVKYVNLNSLLQDDKRIKGCVCLSWYVVSQKMETVSVLKCFTKLRLFFERVKCKLWIWPRQRWEQCSTNSTIFLRTPHIIHG